MAEGGGFSLPNSTKPWPNPVFCSCVVLHIKECYSVYLFLKSQEFVPFAHRFAGYNKPNNCVCNDVPYLICRYS